MITQQYILDAYTHLCVLYLNINQSVSQCASVSFLCSEFSSSTVPGLHRTLLVLSTQKVYADPVQLCGVCVSNCACVSDVRMNGSLTPRSRSVKTEITAKLEEFLRWIERWSDGDGEMEEGIQNERREKMVRETKGQGWQKETFLTAAALLF